MRPTPTIDKYIAPLFCTTGEKPLLFTLELELLSAPLPIKRTLKIPSNMNLGYVQEVLMLAMGWGGYHLKEIRHGNYTYFVRLAGGQDPEPVEGFPQRDSFKYTLGDLLKEEWDSYIFVYDLGDAWKHCVTLTGIASCKEEDVKEDAVAAHLFPAKTPARPKMSEASMAMPMPSSHSTTQKMTSTIQSANGWVKTSIRTSLIFDARAVEWMISSEPLARQGGGSIR